MNFFKFILLFSPDSCHLILWWKDRDYFHIMLTVQKDGGGEIRLIEHYSDRLALIGAGIADI